MYDFCSTITGVLSVFIILFGIIGAYNSRKAKDAEQKDFSKSSNIGSADNEETPDDSEQ